MPTNQQIINKAGTAIQTGSLTHGLLQPEQARKFIQQTFDATNLGPLVRHVMRTSKSGEIDKIGIASRILRAKVENTDDGYRAGVNTNVIEYACKAVRLPWEITEESEIVAQAQSWIGCKEADGSHKKIIDLYNNHKPLARGYKVKYTDAWCATFASACAIAKGYTNIIPTECGCDKLIALFQTLSL